MQVKRTNEVRGEITVRNNSTLEAVSKEETHLEINFVFTSKYQPQIGEIKIEGVLTYRDEPQKLDQALEKWKNSDQQNLPEEMAENVHNTIFSNCVVEATILSKQVQLPPPMPAPQISLDKGGRLKKKKENKNEKGKEGMGKKIKQKINRYIR